jgi:hypothetical protein
MYVFISVVFEQIPIIESSARCLPRRLYDMERALTSETLLTHFRYHV